MRSRWRILSVFIGVLGFVLVLGDPLQRFVTCQQLCALGIGSAGLLLLLREDWSFSVRNRVPAVIVLFGLLALLFTLSTSAGFLTQRHVDYVQGIRDLRDLLIALAVFVVWSLVRVGFGRSLVRPFCIGIAAGVGLEIALRPSDVYLILFNPPEGGYRYVAGFLGPNEYGALGSIVSAMGIAYLISGRRSWEIPMGGLLMILGSYVTVTSGSRGAILGVAVAGAVTTLVWALDSFCCNPLRVLTRITLLAGVVGGGAIFVARTALKDIDSGHLILRRVESAGIEFGLQSRLVHLGVCLEMGTRNPLLGTGLGGYSAQNEGLGGTGTLSPHNELGKAFAESGLPGVLLLILLFLLIGLLALKRRKEKDGYALLGGIVAFFVAEQFFSYLVRPGLALVFVILAASLSGGTVAPCDRRRSI